MTSTHQFGAGRSGWPAARVASARSSVGSRSAPCGGLTRFGEDTAAFTLPEQKTETRASPGRQRRGAAAWGVVPGLLRVSLKGGGARAEESAYVRITQSR